MGIEFGRNFAMLFSVKKGHVERLFFLMAFRTVVFVGLPMLLYKELRVSLIVLSGRITLIRWGTCGTDCGLVSSCGNLHSLVACSIYPVNTVFPSLCTCTARFMNMTVRPLSHSTPTDQCDPTRKNNERYPQLLV